MNIENAKTWSAALRSDEYPQCRGLIQDGDKFCCLGVAHIVLIGPIHFQCYTAVEKALEFNEGQSSVFIGLNDSEKKSFNEIADYIDQQIEEQIRDGDAHVRRNNRS